MDFETFNIVTNIREFKSRVSDLSALREKYTKIEVIQRWNLFANYTLDISTLSVTIL